jgi:hypothetical protein
MPQSNKRSPAYQIPIRVGLQSCCSILPGSPPHRLRQATVSHQTHARRNPCLSGRAGLQPPAPQHTRISAPQPRHRIHGHRDPRHPSTPDPSPEPVPELARTPAPPPPAHCPSVPAEPQLRVGQPDPCPSDSHPSGPARLQLCVERLEPCPTGTGTSLAQDRHIHQPTRNPALQSELGPALQAFQITAPPVSCSSRH